MVLHKQIIVSGKVADTGFRFYALKGAFMHRINGHVTQQDKKIIIDAEGDDIALQNFIEWCSLGPSCSKVSSVFVVEKPIYGYSDFKIL